ncbi:MAG: ClbS/DfsB family four-helix bundle protein [Hyphomicrobiales bacterium]|nr:ClbS/DfsB family four-helix bundle protein [Hyphomicrobiales bacterium]
MAATDKAELIGVAEKEFSKLKTTLDGIDEKTANIPHPTDGITIKDTIVHRAHWLGLFEGWYRGGKDGETVVTPAPGYKWNQLKAYNAKVREDASDVSWPSALARLENAHNDFVALLDGIDEAELYEPHRYAWTNNWTVGRWAESSGPSHYRSANKYIREIVRKTTERAALN